MSTSTGQFMLFTLYSRATPKILSGNMISEDGRAGGREGGKDEEGDAI